MSLEFNCSLKGKKIPLLDSLQKILMKCLEKLKSLHKLYYYHLIIPKSNIYTFATIFKNK